MFDLHNLGWNSFQQLCLTITREILGQTVEAFLDSNDGGRDGAFTGNWKKSKHEDFSGRFVIQCKFTNRRNYALKTSDLSDEIPKTKRLIAAGHCDSYVLMTNASLSGRRDEEIKELFREAGVRHVAVLGSTWINQQIRENKRLRMLVPRVYGLGDLSQILDERAYAQARAIIESMREDLAKVVVTDAYRKAVEAINEHGFVLLKRLCALLSKEPNSTTSSWPSITTSATVFAGVFITRKKSPPPSNWITTSCCF